MRGRSSLAALMLRLKQGRIISDIVAGAVRKDTPRERRTVAAMR